MHSGKVVLLAALASSLLYGCTTRDHELSKSIFAATISGDHDEVARLLAAGADVNAVFQESEEFDESSVAQPLPADRVPKGFTAECVPTFSSSKTEISLEGIQWGSTPLIVATRYGHQKIVRLFLSKGANVGAANAYGVTALHASIESVRPVELVRLLVESGANVNAKDSKGRTPLHYIGACAVSDVATGKHVEEVFGMQMRAYRRAVVVLLVSNGGNLWALDHERKMPVDLASETGNCETAEMLREIGEGSSPNESP